MLQFCNKHFVALLLQNDECFEYSSAVGIFYQNIVLGTSYTFVSGVCHGNKLCFEVNRGATGCHKSRERHKNGQQKEDKGTHNIKQHEPH
jgi:hypothetical protein